jgi:hypothetical protein
MFVAWVPQELSAPVPRGGFILCAPQLGTREIFGYQNRDIGYAGQNNIKPETHGMQ